MQNIFVTAMDIHWTDHLMAQSVWQRWIGNAIAKTINMPYDVTADDVKSAYLLAHEMGLKGITVYRDGSRHKQVLHMTSENAEKTFDVRPSGAVTAFVTKHIKSPYVLSQVNASLVSKTLDDELAASSQHSSSNTSLSTPSVPPEGMHEDKRCPACTNNLIFAEGCSTCIECGYSECTSG